MSSKRGRPPLPPERRRHVRVTVAVTADVADAMFIYAQRKREPLSTLLSRIFERIAERELTAYQKSELIGVIAR